MSTGIREDEPTSSKRPKLEPGTSVHPKLLNRKWLEISPTSISEVRSEIIRDSFKVMQFNTLADGKLLSLPAVYIKHFHYNIILLSTCSLNIHQMPQGDFKVGVSWTLANQGDPQSWS